MSLGIIATKRRIKSVNSTKKITKAMELVSTSKLKRCRDAFDRNSVYTSETYELVKEVLANVKNSDNQYLVKNISFTCKFILHLLWMLLQVCQHFHRSLAPYCHQAVLCHPLRHLFYS